MINREMCSSRTSENVLVSWHFATGGATGVGLNFKGANPSGGALISPGDKIPKYIVGAGPGEGAGPGGGTGQVTG